MVDNMSPLDPRSRYASPDKNGGGMDRKRTDRYILSVRMMLVAQITAEGSTCSRRAVGCVLTRNDKVVATGYNGAPVHTKHGIDFEDGCPKNDRGSCIQCVHAEMNACLQCEGSAEIAYCTDQPCLNCTKALIQKGVQYIYYWRPYEDPDRIQYFKVNDIDPISVMGQVQSGLISKMEKLASVL